MSEVSPRLAISPSNFSRTHLFIFVAIFNLVFGAVFDFFGVAVELHGRVSVARKINYAYR
jgi:hypothetical protein